MECLDISGQQGMIALAHVVNHCGTPETLSFSQLPPNSPLHCLSLFSEFWPGQVSFFMYKHVLMLSMLLLVLFLNAAVTDRLVALAHIVNHFGIPDTAPFCQLLFVK